MFKSLKTAFLFIQAGMTMTTMSAAAMGSSGVAMPAALATTQVV